MAEKEKKLPKDQQQGADQPEGKDEPFYVNKWEEKEEGRKHTKNCKCKSCKKRKEMAKKGGMMMAGAATE